jgi:hypothetical protein
MGFFLWRLAGVFWFFPLEFFFWRGYYYYKIIEGCNEK